MVALDLTIEMPAQRRMYPGDPRGGPSKPMAERKPDRIDIYTVFWKDVEDNAKGSIWLYHSRELMKAGGFRSDLDISYRQSGYRPSLVKARGKKWFAIYSDEDSFMYLASPMATKKLMANIVSRWPNPPIKLRPEKGAVFSLHDMQDENHSHVYLVQLLTFHQTAEGQYYYKIGKAKSIPRRIKQFGPCRLVRSIKLPTEQVSLKVEAELHSKFSHLRRPDTEIFCMTEAELETVVDEYMRHEASENS
jgi:hypothetical protein